MKAIRLGWIFLMPFLAAPAPPAAATQQEGTPSVAEAARRAKEQKKSQPKPKQVWTNDNIPKNPGAISVVGQAEQPEQQPPAPDENPKPAEKAAAPSDASGLLKQLADAKARLASLQTELDLLQRTSALDQQSYYGKPGYADDKEGKAKLDALSKQVEAKRTEVQAAEQEVAQIQAKVTALEPKGKPAEAKPTPPPS
jgi:uncharacterized coiled-coil protein SlyX